MNDQKISQNTPAVKRISRSDFWPAIIALNILIGVCAWGTGAFSLVTIKVLCWIVLLTLEFRAIIATVERLHDTNRSGWNYLWFLLPIAGPIILIVFLCEKGTDGPNRFGEPSTKSIFDPKN